MVYRRAANVSHNCLDVHLANRGDKVAVIFEGEPGDVRKLTYTQLHQDVCRFANALKAQGVGRGDAGSAGRASCRGTIVPVISLFLLAFSSRFGIDRVMHHLRVGGRSTIGDIRISESLKHESRLGKAALEKRKRAILGRRHVPAVPKSRA